MHNLFEVGKNMTGYYIHLYNWPVFLLLQKKGTEMTCSNVDVQRPTGEPQNTNSHHFPFNIYRSTCVITGALPSTRFVKVHTTQLQCEADAFDKNRAIDRFGEFCGFDRFGA